MKTKVLSILLCICMLIPCFAVLGFAEDSEVISSSEDVYVPEDLYQMIDVQAYIDNAGKEDYDSLKLLGFALPNLIEVKDPGNNDLMGYKWYIYFYVYNPLKYEFLYRFFEFQPSMSYGYANCKDIDDSSIQNYDVFPVVQEAPYDGVQAYNDLFLTFRIDGFYSVESYEANIEIQNEYYIDSLSLFSYQRADYDDNALDEEISLYFDFNNLEVSLDYNDYSVMYMYTDPAQDLASLFNSNDGTELNITDVHEKYPVINRPGNGSLTEPIFLTANIPENRLFFYVYNPTGNGVSTKLNPYVYIKLDGEDEYTRVKLKYRSSSGCIDKFLIDYTLPQDKSFKVYLFNYSYLSNKSNTEFEKDLTWGRKEVSYYIEPIEISTFTNDGTTKKAIHVQSEFVSIDQSKVGHSYYMLDSSVTGDDYYQTLVSCYFRLPSSYFASTNTDILNNKEITKIFGQYIEGYTNPCLVTNNLDVYNAFYNLSGTDLNDSKYILFTGCPEGSGFMDTDSNTLITSYYCDYVFGDISSLTSGLSGLFNRVLASGGAIKPSDKYNFVPEKLGTVFYSENIEDFKSSVSSESIEYSINDLGEETVLVYLSDEVTDFVITPNKEFKLSSLKEWTFAQSLQYSGFINTFLNKILGGENDYMDSLDEEDIKAIIQFSDDELLEAQKLDNSVFSTKYHVAESDVAAIKKQMQDAYDNDETFILFRFDVFDYFSQSGIKIWEHSDNSMYRSSLDNKGTEFVFVNKYYKDFDIMKFQIENSQEAFIYQVDMEPISFVGADAVAPYPDASERLEDFFGDDPDWWDELIAKLKEIGKYVAIFLIVIIVIPFIGPIASVLGIVITGIKNAFKGIGSLIKKIFKRE